MYALCQLDSVLTLAVYGCSQSSPVVSWLRGVFKNVTLFGPYVADYGRGVCVCPLSVGLCSDFGSLWVFTKLSFCQLAKGCI